MGRKSFRCLESKMMMVVVVVVVMMMMVMMMMMMTTTMTTTMYNDGCSGCSSANAAAHLYL